VVVEIEQSILLVYDLRETALGHLRQTRRRNSSYGSSGVLFLSSASVIS